MSELRAPDPTLTAHAVEDGTIILSYRGDEPPFAHAVGVEHEPACGSEDADHWCETEHVRWFAVPCRDCFPDASDPGRADRRTVEPWDRVDPDDGALYVLAKSLAWQVRP